MSDLKVQGVVEMSSEGAENAFDRIADKADQMANKAAGASQKAGDAVDKIGGKAVKSASDFNNAEGKISASIKRATTNLENLGKTASQKLELRIADKGLDPAKFEPMLAKLRELEAAQGRAGISAGQMSMAMRGLPAQFTDIATSLASGQNPMTVFLQQGGQIKDMFGGAGAAARAMGGYVAGLVNPFTVAAAAVAGLGLAYYQGSKEADAYAKALILSGNAVGVTTGQLSGMAAAIASASGATKGMAADALAQLAATGKVAAEGLDSAGQAAINMERFAGKAIADTVAEFAELGKEPVKASEKLNEKYRYLTAAIYEQIKALEEQGRTSDAARLAQESYADAMNERAGKLKENLGTLESAWHSVGDAAKRAIDSMLNIGRDDLETQIANQVKYIQDLRKTPYYVDTSRAERELTELQKKAEKRKQEAYDAAEQTRVQAAGVAAVNAVTAANDKALSSQERMNKALAEYRDNITKVRAANPASALLDPAKIASAEKAIRDQFADKTRKTGGESQAVKDAKELARVLDSLDVKQSALDLGFSDETIKSMDVLNRAVDAGRLSWAAYEQAVGTVLDKDTVLAKEQADIAKAMKDRSDAFSRIVAEEQKRADSLGKSNDSLRDEIAVLGLSAEQQEAYRASKLESAAASAILEASELEAAAAIRDASGKLPELAEGYLALASAKRAAAAELSEQASLSRQKAAKEIAVKQAEDSAKAWQDFGRDIERSLTDSLYRSFERGDDFGKAFVDSLKNTFKTTVLKLAVQAVVSPIMGSVQQAFGVPGAGQSSGASGGGLLNLASAISRGNEGFYAGYNAFSASSIGQSLGLYQAASPGYAAPVYNATANGMVLESAGAGTAGGMTSLGQGVGQALPYLASVMSFANGDIGGGIGAGIGAAVGGPVGAAIGQVLGSTIGDAIGLNGDGDAQRESKYNRRFGQSTDYGFGEAAGGSHYYKNNRWFSGGEMGDAMRQFDASGVAAETNLIRSLKLSADQIAAIDAELIANAEKSYQFGMEHTNWLDSSADEAITFDRLTAASKALGISMEEVAAAMDPAFGGLADLAEMLGYTSKEAVSLSRIFGGIANASQALASYYQDYYSEDEKRAATLGKISETLATVNIALPETRAQFRALVEGLDVSTSAGQDTYKALMSVAGAFAQVTPAAEAAAQATADAVRQQYDAATSALRSAYEAQRGVINDQISAYQDQERAARDLAGEWKNLGDTLSQTLQGLRLDDPTLSDQARYDQASAAFDDVARRASLGDQAAMQQMDGVAATFLEASQKNASSLEEYARDRAKVENAFVKSLGVAERQKTIAEQQADYAKQQVSLAEASLKALETQIKQFIDLNTSVLSVEQAIRDMTQAIASAAALQIKTGVSPIGTRAVDVVKVDTTPAGWKVENAKVDADAVAQFVSTQYHDALGRVADQEGLAYWSNQLKTGAITMDNLDDAMLAAAKNALADQTVLKNYEEVFGAAAFLNGSHADGLPRVPFDGYRAELHAGEAVIDAAGVRSIQRYFGVTPAAGGQDNAALIEEIRRLNARLEAIERNTARANESLQQLPNRVQLVEIAA